MSDKEEPKQQPTPAKTPKKSLAPEQEESEMEDPGYQSGRSRSQSRRRRRQNQRQRAQQQQQEGGAASGAQAQSMTKIEEEPNVLPEEEPENVMQPFERIGPPSSSMDGPVTFARAMRGEIPMRGADPRTVGNTGQNVQPDAKAGGKDIMDEPGLKLRLELNLDIEIELKASIHGDLTLALMA